MTRFKLVSFLLALALTASLPVMAQRGRGGRGAPPPVPQAMQDVANAIAAAINAQDGDALTAMLADGAVFLDEDGHALPATAWIGRVTGEGEGVEISGMRGEVLDDTGWVSFNFEFVSMYQGNAVTIPGTASIVVQNTGGNWMIHMVHSAFEQHLSDMLAARQNP